MQVVLAFDISIAQLPATASVNFILCVQVVVVSPLMRALETAAGAFGAGPFKGEGRPLMLSQTGELDERAPHAAVACPEGIPFIAFEGCRERLGMHTCLNLPFLPRLPL